MRIIPLSLAIGLGWKSYSTFSRLLHTIAVQEYQPDQVVFLVNANNLSVPDNLLFDSHAWKVNNRNGFHEDAQKPSLRQIRYWNWFMRQTGAQTQALSLSRLHNVQYIWAGFDPAIKDLHRGPSATRLRALSYVQNEWVSYFDDDDLMHPNRLKFLWTAIEKEDDDLDAMYQSSSMFKLNDTRSIKELLSWWFDPFVIYTDKNDIPAEFESLPREIEEHFAGNYTAPLTQRLQERIEKARKLPLHDIAHVPWRDALSLSRKPEVPKKCAAVINGAAPPSYAHDLAITNGNVEVHNHWPHWDLYLNYVYPSNIDAWKNNVTDPHVEGLGNGGNLQIHMGWITVKKQIFESIKPIDSKYDDNTYQFWRMNSVCRKTRFNFNVLGLYLKPYLYEY